MMAQFRNAPGPNTPILAAHLDQMTASIINIRQTQYDATTNVRYCSAQYSIPTLRNDFTY
jgi:hypothetical protein